jgi:hypothetical protein
VPDGKTLHIFISLSFCLHQEVISYSAGGVHCASKAPSIWCGRDHVHSADAREAEFNVSLQLLRQI